MILHVMLMPAVMMMGIALDGVHPIALNTGEEMASVMMIVMLPAAVMMTGIAKWSLSVICFK